MSPEAGLRSSRIGSIIMLGDLMRIRVLDPAPSGLAVDADTDLDLIGAEVEDRRPARGSGARRQGHPERARVR